MFMKQTALSVIAELLTILPARNASESRSGEKLWLLMKYIVSQERSRISRIKKIRYLLSNCYCALMHTFLTCCHSYIVVLLSRHFLSVMFDLCGGYWCLWSFPTINRISDVIHHSVSFILADWCLPSIDRTVCMTWL